MSKISPNVLKAFLKEFDRTKEEERRKNSRLAKMAAEKEVKLEPVKVFLRTLSTLGVQLTDGRVFQFYEKESSPSWQPGISLFFDYPAPIEIAIPNNPIKEGALVIRVTKEIKDANLLEQRFDSVEEGLEVLAAYIGRNTYQMDIDPRNKQAMLERIQHKKQLASNILNETDGFTDVAPIEIKDGSDESTST